MKPSNRIRRNRADGDSWHAAVIRSCNSRTQKATGSWRSLLMARPRSTALARNGPDTRPQHLPESLMRRSSLEEEEVRLTSAIGGSKTDKRNGGAFNQSNVFRPEMLQTPSVETVADFF